MGKYKIRILLTLAAILTVSICSVLGAETKPLRKALESISVSEQNQDSYKLSVAQIEELIGAGKCKAALRAFNRLKTDFPEIIKPDSNDFDLLVEAEILLCKGKLVEATRQYGKLLDEIPTGSRFYLPALERQFEIATAFLAGAKKPVFRIFKIKGYAEGVRIMEDIGYRLALEDPYGMGLKAELAVAKSYQERKKYDEAFYRWAQIKDKHQNDELGKEALLSMAECKLAMYKGPNYDNSDLIGRPLNPSSFYESAKSCYEEFRLKYPQDVEKYDIEKKIKDVDETVASKQFKIGQYYQGTGNILSANLYFQMIIYRWPDTVTAKIAEQMLIQNTSSQEKTE
ncbi:MAG: outer membrane protein assembly factor BamD [Planctomycetota bacterium]